MAYTKIDEKDIPDAINKWTDNFDDFWLNRYLRTLGYTIDDIVELARSNDDIRLALKFAWDALFEKTIYKVASGTMKAELASFVFKTYLDRFNEPEGKVINVSLGLDNFDNGDNDE